MVWKSNPQIALKGYLRGTLDEGWSAGWENRGPGSRQYPHVHFHRTSHRCRSHSERDLPLKRGALSSAQPGTKTASAAPDPSGRRTAFRTSGGCAGTHSQSCEPRGSPQTGRSSMDICEGVAANPTCETDRIVANAVERAMRYLCMVTSIRRAIGDARILTSIAPLMEMTPVQRSESRALPSVIDQSSRTTSATGPASFNSRSPSAAT